MSSQAHISGPGPPPCPPTAPSLLLPAFPGAALLVTSADAPGSKLIIKLKREGPAAGGPEEIPRTQTFFLTGMPLGWATPRREVPSGPGVHTVLVTKAVEDLGGRKPRVPEPIPPARAPPPSDASFACTSKGVYENYRRWQRYKALARRHFPDTPDAEALACFFIPVLRSLARLRPDMTLEDGVPRAVQEWEHSSNFERMIFYEMAEKFMEFEAEEEQQIQKMKLLASCSHFQAPVPKSTKPAPAPSPFPESSQGHYFASLRVKPLILQGTQRGSPDKMTAWMGGFYGAYTPLRPWAGQIWDKGEYKAIHAILQNIHFHQGNPSLEFWESSKTHNEVGNPRCLSSRRGMAGQPPPEFTPVSLCSVQVYIPKKSVSKSRQPRRRQRRPPSTSAPGAPREIPAEAVHQYAEIMDGLDASWEEEEEEKKEPAGGKGPRDPEEATFPDPGLLQYIDQLCGDEEFVCKVEAIIHPQFIASLQSAEKSQDPLDLVEELEEELNLTPSQLIEKRLLVLSEEEREPSVCPTSHSDSTPSQSEEEDDSNNGGKGKETSPKAAKRTSANKGLRASQSETPGSGTGSPFLPSSHERVGKRDSPPKTVRASLTSSPHRGGSHDSREERALPSPKNTDERETQNFQKQIQVGINLGQAKGIPPRARRKEIGPIMTENNRQTGKKNSQQFMTGQGTPRPHNAAGSREDGGLGKVQVQEEIQRAPEQGGHTAKPPSHEESQLMWQKLDPAHSASGTCENGQQGEIEHGKGSQAIREGEKHAPKGTDYANQNVNKMLLGDRTSAERALQKNSDGHGGQHFEKATSPSQGQGVMGSEDTSRKAELDNPGVKSQRDNQMNQFSEQPACKNRDGCQQEGLTDHVPFRASQNGMNSALKAALPQCRSAASSGKSIAGHKRPMAGPAESGEAPDGQEAKDRLQKVSQISWEETKHAPLKIKSSPGKALQGYADNLAPSTTAEQDGRQPSWLPILETGQQVNCPVLTPSVELSGCQGHHLASTVSAEVRGLKGQLPRTSTKHLSSPNSSGLESPSPCVQKGPHNAGKFQKAQWLFSDQGEVTSWVGNQPGVRQTLHPALNPSDFILAVEANGGNRGGPSGDHLPRPSHSGIKAEPLSPRHSDRNRNEEPKLLSSEDLSEEVTPGSELRNLGQVADVHDLPEPTGEAGTALPEPSGANAEGAEDEDQVEEEDEEDEELSSFSSLLASKLSLSPRCDHTLCPAEREDTVPSSPSETGKPVSQGSHSVRVQVSQDAIVLLSKNLSAHPTMHRSPKRKSNNLGTRRSKRLRNQ
ncbi:NUT family member 1 [Paroedura picta]|uniref:NUT family member 1 n=1 Tax=Paroedura picta TaxID=143630 RepID=UPI004056DD21